MHCQFAILCGLIIVHVNAESAILHGIRSSRVSLAPDGEHIAVYNMAKGVEVRSLSDGTVRCAFPPDSGEKHLLPVNFVHGGGGVVVGATDGNVGVWDLRYSIKIQDLPHPSASAYIPFLASFLTFHEQSRRRCLRLP